MNDNNDVSILNNNVTFKQNREISWLKFNQRVLQEANDTSVPELEKLKFVSIYCTNLDEFFMVRVGSLYDKSIYTPNSIDNKSGMTPAEQLDSIYKMAHDLNIEYNETYWNVEEELRDHEICSLSYEELENREKKFVKKYFNDNISPLLSPQIVDPHHPFPHLRNKSIYICCILKHKSRKIFGIVPIPETLRPLIFLPGQAYRYIHVEKVILEFVDDIFESYEMIEKTCLCVTRNADISPDDDTYKENIDFRKQMRELLHLRKRLAVVRLETSTQLGTYFTKYLCQKLAIAEHQIYVITAPLRMEYAYGLVSTVTQDSNKDLIYPPFEPVNSKPNSNTNMIKLAGKKDLIFHYPYVSMKPFLRLLKQSANDPNVLSIKITIYRLAMKATIVDYLCAAAENGKDVTVLIELRARFDEQNNIDWSEKLEDAGCKVLYGIDDYKVHSKICLITYKDHGKIKFITQVGTGNYNEKTAKQYTDLSFITGNYEIGQDATEYFKNMSIGNLKGQYKHFLVAPFSLKPRLLDLIDEEIAKGQDGRIVMKINSISDIDIINKLAEASTAGVKITMVVRGICCILPGVSGMTENIEIRSIVGRFLEHTRIYSFGTGNEQKLFISSADMMTRNLDRRVEVACPIYDSEIKKELNEILKIVLSDNVKARIIDFNGDFNIIENGKLPFKCQEAFIEQALQRKNKRSNASTPVLTRFKDFMNSHIPFLKNKD